MSDWADPLPFETERLRLRRLRIGDLAAFQAYRADPEVGRWQGWTPMDEPAARSFLQEMAASPWCPRGDWMQLAIARRDGDTLLGDMGLYLDDTGHTLDLGFTLARHAQGQGLASEAVRALLPKVFEHTLAQRVRAITDVRNTASVALLQRCGFRHFATLAGSFRGEPCEEHHFVFHRGSDPLPHVRAATAADAEDVAALLIRTRAELMPFAPSAHSESDLRQWVAQTLIPTGGVTVAELQGRIAGVLALQVRAGVGWIDQLMVDPLQVRRGIGRTLLKHALKTLPRPVQLWTFQPNHAARRFYESQGFQAVAFTEGDNEEGVPDVMYRLDAAQ